MIAMMSVGTGAWLDALGLPADVQRPLRPGGGGRRHRSPGLGALHRAHQAVYADDVSRDPRWGICGASMKTPRAIEPLAAQDGLYTLLLKEPASTRRGDRRRARIAFAPADPAARGAG
jgi:hypothetical protein